jgi:uncharacterized protein YjiS (DUF1127 family)
MRPLDFLLRTDHGVHLMSAIHSSGSRNKLIIRDDPLRVNEVRFALDVGYARPFEKTTRTLQTDLSDANPPPYGLTLAAAPEVKASFAGDRQQNFGCFMSPHTSPSKCGNWLTSLRYAIVTLWTNWRHEREVNRAIAALWELDDRILRDIGIVDRSQIDQVVRTQK